MVRLTEEMVAARTRVSDCLSVKKLNCWGTELTDVSILRKMRKVEVLSLSVNNIKTLADFQNCIDLKDLFVRKNNIQDINEVCYLQGLPNLRNLWLGENPCADIEGYRLAVLKALPKLEKLDDKVVTQEELRTAVLKGRALVHPLSSLNQESECSPQSAPESPEIQYSEDHEVNQGENYSSSDDQRSCDEAVNDDYQETDKRNANYNTQPVQQYPPNNRYNYEQNGQTKQTDNNLRNNSYKEDPNTSNIIETQQEYNERNTPLRHNGDYEDINQRSYAASSPRVPYPTTEYEERRSEYDESHRSVSAQSRQRIFQNVERDDPTQSPGWIKRADRGRHYQRRPITRNSNILSAVLCLVKELDYPSLEVVEMAVRSRIDELEE